MLRVTKRIFVIVSAGLVIIEIIIRLFGLVDFPLFEANNLIGYAVKPNQSGSFMNKNDWVFNSLGMGGREFVPKHDKTDVLLIGDSIVYGGNPYRQLDRLGPQMERISSSVQIWPISAGSWALQNELTWLETHPEVLSQIDKIYFVLNKGDFLAPSSWKCETTHPLEKPVFSLGFLIKKYIWDWSNCSIKESPFPVLDDDWRPRLKSFMARPDVKKIKVIFYLYPNKEDVLNKDVFYSWGKVAKNELNLAGAANVILLFEKDVLPDNFFLDEIHPSVYGMSVLARELLTMDK